jgi:hypothetical protein
MVSRIAAGSSTNSSGETTAPETSGGAVTTSGTPESAAGGSSQAASTSKSNNSFDVAAKSAVGTRDSLLLGALVLGFAFAVGAVVVAAGVRGGRRTH